MKMRSLAALWCSLCLLTMLPFLSSTLTEPATWDEDSLDLVDTDDGSASSWSDDEDLGDLFTGVADDVSFRCYNCTGVTGVTGCNITVLLQKPRDYITECTGHCLNISAGNSVVFECVNDVPVRKTTCLQNKGTRMCMCATDLCNGPSADLHLSTPRAPPGSDVVFPETSTIETEPPRATVTMETKTPKENVPVGSEPSREAVTIETETPGETVTIDMPEENVTIVTPGETVTIETLVETVTIETPGESVTMETASPKRAVTLKAKSSGSRVKDEVIVIFSACVLFLFTQLLVLEQR